MAYLINYYEAIDVHNYCIYCVFVLITNFISSIFIKYSEVCQYIILSQIMDTTNHFLTKRIHSN